MLRDGASRLLSMRVKCLILLILRSEHKQASRRIVTVRSVFSTLLGHQSASISLRRSLSGHAHSRRAGKRGFESLKKITVESLVSDVDMFHCMSWRGFSPPGRMNKRNGPTHDRPQPPVPTTAQGPEGRIRGQIARASAGTGRLFQVTPNRRRRRGIPPGAGKADGASAQALRLGGNVRLYGLGRGGRETGERLPGLPGSIGGAWGTRPVAGGGSGRRRKGLRLISPGPIRLREFSAEYPVSGPSCRTRCRRKH